MLIAAAIIAILAGMLLPALNKARARGKAIACASDQKGVAAACMMYADNHDGNWFYFSDRAAAGKQYGLYTWNRVLCDNNYMPRMQSSPLRAKLHCTEGGEDIYRKDGISEDNQPPYMINSMLPTWYDGGGSLVSFCQDDWWAFQTQGIKNSMVKNPSGFVTLACKKYQDGNSSSSSFQKATQFSLKSKKDYEGTGDHMMNTDAHGSGANYAFFDGHVQQIQATEIKLEYFMLRPEWASETARRYNAYNQP